MPADKPQPELYHEAGKTFKELLSRDDIPCLIMALPILAQPDYIKAALDAGKHVLAEKPIAKDVATAQDLIAYSKNTKGTLAIAENIRFYENFTFAREHAKDLGPVTHFAVRVYMATSEESPYYKTTWRKTPEYQGGFLLDGGVHWAAGTRFLLTGENDKVASVVAQSALVRPHLPPIDTVSAILTTKGGALGTYSHSAGSNMSLFDWEVAYANGSVSVVGGGPGRNDTVTVRKVGQEPITKEFGRMSGVPEEVAAWAQSVVDGKPNPLQSPEQALADLEFLEKMFSSDGKTQTYELQI